MARLLAYGRVSPAGMLSWSPQGIERAAWSEPPGEYGIPRLRARQLFDQPHAKFGRMDPLCKAAVAAAQLAYKASGELRGIQRDDVAQVGGTMLGCLEVDAQFEATRVKGAPSPVLFVYTLPSMFQGEVAIQYGLRGRCTLLSNGPLSALTALSAGLRWIEKSRAPHVLVIGADAAGPAAEARGYVAQTAAAAWLLGSTGGLGLASAMDGEALAPGALTHGCTFVDALEERLLAGERCEVSAGGVAFRIGES